MKNTFNNYKSADLPVNSQKCDDDISKYEKKSKSRVPNEIHNLNKQFMFFLDACITQNPCADLSPCVRDYLNFIDEIKSKYGPNCGSNETKIDSVAGKTHDIPISSAPLTIDSNSTNFAKPDINLKSTPFSPPLTSMLFSGSATSNPQKPIFETSRHGTTNDNVPATTFASKLNSEPQNNSIRNSINSFPNIPKITEASSNVNLAWQLPGSTGVLASQPFSFAPSATSSFTSNPPAASTFPQSSVTAFLNSLPPDKDSLGFLTQPVTTLSTAPAPSGFAPFPFGNIQSTSNPLSTTGPMPFSSTFSSSLPFQAKTDATISVSQSVPINSFSIKNVTGLNSFSSPFSNAPPAFNSIFSQETPVQFTADISSLEKNKDIEYTAQTDDENQQVQNTNLGFEPDALFSCKSKLFVKGARKFEEMGVGIINLKSIPNDESSIQIVFRLESSRAGSLLMNLKIPKQSKHCSRNSKVDLAIISKPNPPISEFCKEAQPQNSDIVTYLVKVKTPEDMNEIVQYLGLTPAQ